MRQIHSILFVFLVIFLIGTVPNVLSADDVNLTKLYSVKEITQTSLTLAEINLQNGNVETSQQFIDFASQQFSNNLKELSMGMSLDYLIALKFKSTFLRIGTKIFGERN